MDIEKHLKIAEKIADLFDNKFEIFGFRFGIDPLIGLIPVAGDILPFGFTLYLIWIGWMNNLSINSILKMVFNSILDFAIGFIPFVGDLGDFVYKSHTKNFQILKEHLLSWESKIIEGEIAT